MVGHMAVGGCYLPVHHRFRHRYLPIHKPLKGFECSIRRLPCG